MSNHIQQLEEQIKQLAAAGQPTEMADKYFELADLQTAGGMIEAAAGNYHRVLELSPDHIAAMNNLGQSLYRLGKIEEAESWFEKVITRRSDIGEVYYNLGNCLLTLGRRLEAVAQYRQALDLRHEYPEAWYNLGVALKELGKYRQAAESFMTGQRLAPENIDGWFMLGMMYQLQEMIPDAVTAYQKALEIGEHPMAAYNSGICRHAQGNYPAAIEMFNQAIAWQPDNAAAWNNLGRSLEENQQAAEACRAYEKAVAIKPDFCDAIANSGNIRREKGEVEAAIAAYKDALSHDPGHAQSLYNLGCCYQGNNELDTAEQWYRRAIEIKPDLVEAHWNLSHVLLLRGEYDEGFKEYQWRWKRPATPMPHLEIPEWHGDKETSATLLVHTEQGFGDTIQFARYLPLLRERLGRIIFVCEESLIPLFVQNNLGVDAIVPKAALGAVANNCDLHTGLLALPAFFTSDDPASIPAPIVFAVSEKLVNEYEDIFCPGDGKMKIGIVWQGSKGHKNDKNRSCPLDEFTPLFDCPETSFYSLQKEAGGLSAGMPVCDLSSKLTDFHYTAALIHHLDLVICVDTSVAHLAASMGKKVWLMLPYVPDWRWRISGDDTPWYPNMRIFRQGESRQWSEVVRAMRDKLIKIK